MIYETVVKTSPPFHFNINLFDIAPLIQMLGQNNLISCFSNI